MYYSKDMKGMETVTVQVKRLAGCEDLPLPKYMTLHSAGMDMCAAVKEDYILNAGKRALIPTGLAIALPPGFEAQIRPRSGLAIKYGIGLLNAPGTIDADYRGEIKIIMINLGEDPFIIKRGDRIAQMIIHKVIHGQLVDVDELPESARDEGGFGHTGT